MGPIFGVVVHKNLSLFHAERRYSISMPSSSNDFPGLEISVSAGRAEGNCPRPPSPGVHWSTRIGCCRWVDHGVVVRGCHRKCRRISSGSRGRYQPGRVRREQVRPFEAVASGVSAEISGTSIDANLPLRRTVRVLRRVTERCRSGDRTPNSRGMRCKSVPKLPYYRGRILRR